MLAMDRQMAPSARSHSREGERCACRTDVKCDVTGWEELGDRKLKVSWRFKCILEVPWRPILAAAGAPLTPHTPPALHVSKKEEKFCRNSVEGQHSTTRHSSALFYALLRTQLPAVNLSCGAVRVHTWDGAVRGGGGCAGSTTYVGSVETGRILEHIEAWDVEPEQVLKRLLKPSNKRVAEDGTAIEQFMDAASRGDFAKGWSVAALPMLVVLVPDALLTSGASYVFQEGGLGAFLFALQIALWGLCGACAVTVAASKLQRLRS